MVLGRDGAGGGWDQVGMSLGETELCTQAHPFVRPRD